VCVCGSVCVCVCVCVCFGGGREGGKVVCSHTRDKKGVESRMVRLNIYI